METSQLNQFNRIESQPSGHPSKLHAQGAAVYRLASAMVRRAHALAGDSRLAPWEQEERAADLVAEAYAVVAEEPLRWAEAEPLEVMREAGRRCGLHRREARRRQLVEAIESETQRHNGRAMMIRERIVDETRPWRYATCLMESKRALWEHAQSILLDSEAYAALPSSTKRDRNKALANTLPMQLLAWVAGYDT